MRPVVGEMILPVVSSETIERAGTSSFSSSPSPPLITSDKNTSLVLQDTRLIDLFHNVGLGSRNAYCSLGSIRHKNLVGRRPCQAVAGMKVEDKFVQRGLVPTPVESDSREAVLTPRVVMSESLESLLYTAKVKASKARRRESR